MLGEQRRGPAAARRERAIVSTSPLDIRHAEGGLYAAVVGERVAVKLGHREWSPGPGWRGSP